MIFWILSVIGVLLIFVYKARKTEKNYKKILYIYLVVWAVVMIMSSFGFYEMEVPSDYSYTLFLIHLVGFIFGAILIPTSSVSKASSSDYLLKKIENSIVKILESPLFRAILVLMSLYVTYLFSMYWAKVMIYNTMSETRSQIVEIYGSLYYNFARPLLFLPFSMVCYVLFGYAIFKKRDWVCFLMGYMLLVNASLTGGRFGYVFIFVGIVFVNIFIIKIKFRKYLLKFALGVGILYVLIVLTTTFRSGTISLDHNNVENGIEVANEHIVTYMVGSQAAFDYAIENDYLTKLGGYGYGVCTFSPLVFLVDLCTTIFGGFHLNSTNIKLITHLEDDKIYLEGGTKGWNALYTSVIFYYMDAGIIGVFLFPFILGILSSLLIGKMLNSGSVIIFALCGYFFICLIKSLFKMEIFWGYDTLAILVMYIVGYLKDKKHGIKQ